MPTTTLRDPAWWVLAAFLVVLAALALSGCGGPRPAPDFWCNNAAVFLEDQLTEDSGLNCERIARSIARAESYWQAEFDLDGWRLEFWHQPVTCGKSTAGGCFDRKWQTIKVDWLGYPCPESGVFWHELGHFLFKEHEDSRFWDVFFKPFDCE